jgi:hypothetical protein
MYTFQCIEITKLNDDELIILEDLVFAEEKHRKIDHADDSELFKSHFTVYAL